MQQLKRLIAANLRKQILKQLAILVNELNCGTGFLGTVIRQGSNKELFYSNFSLSKVI